MGEAGTALWVAVAAALVATWACVQAWRRGADAAARLAALERAVADGAARQRDEAASHAQAARAEQAASLTTLGRLVGEQVAQLGAAQRAQLEAAAAHAAQADAAVGARQEALRQALEARLGAFGATNETKLEQLRTTVQGRLEAMQADNGQRLEQMRATVDEKLHATLEQRLGESFKLVGERLEMVSRGLGEMQHLASGVGDLRRVLSNIKTRGTWGEVQLGALLEQLLTPEQFAANVLVDPSRSERVDYAVRLPGRTDGIAQVWLPIDAKFPQEDYDRLLVAGDRGDRDEAQAAAQALEARLRLEARKIREKYVCPPHTVDFAIMFLPVEGLFAEALRRIGLFESLLHEFRVVISGPTTLSAMLNSLQMGFRSLAIEKRTSDVWQVLGAVKTEFGNFGEVLSRLQKKLQEASNTVDKVGVRSRAIERKLRDVEATPDAAAGLFDDDLASRAALGGALNLDGVAPLDAPTPASGEPGAEAEGPAA